MVVRQAFHRPKGQYTTLNVTVLDGFKKSSIRYYFYPRASPSPFHSFQILDSGSRISDKFSFETQFRYSNLKQYTELLRPLEFSHLTNQENKNFKKHENDDFHRTDFRNQTVLSTYSDPSLVIRKFR